jgi:hypothetical protein
LTHPTDINAGYRITQGLTIVGFFQRLHFEFTQHWLQKLAIN